MIDKPGNSDPRSWLNDCGDEMDQARLGQLNYYALPLRFDFIQVLNIDGVNRYNCANLYRYFPSNKED